MKRVLTAIVGIPIVVSITLFAPDWIFAFTVGLAAAAAAEEFLSLGATHGAGRPGRWFVAPAGLVTASFIGGAPWVLTTLTLTMLAMLTVPVLTGPIGTAFGRVTAGLGALVYCCITLGFLVLLPRELILALFAIIWVGDSAAYYGGRALGKHPLAPEISPKKTIEGAIAGLIGSVAAGVPGRTEYL